GKAKQITKALLRHLRAVGAQTQVGSDRHGTHHGPSSPRCSGQQLGGDLQEFNGDSISVDYGVSTLASGFRRAAHARYPREPALESRESAGGQTAYLSRLVLGF